MHVLHSPLSRRALFRRSALATAAVAAGPALLTACGDAPGAGGGSGKAVTFPCFLPLETLGLAPEMMAVLGGHFEKHGLDVTLQVVKGSPQATQTLLAGAGPVTRVGQLDLMKAVTEQDQPLVAIGTITQRSAIRYVYSKKDPLVKPEDFVGKTIGVPSEGGTSSQVVDLVVSASGIDPERVPRQVVGLTPGTFTLVEQGRIAGYAVSGDTANIIMSQHPNAGVFDPSTIVKADTQIYMATRETIEQDPDTLRKFLAAIRDSAKSIVDDKANSFDKTIEALRGEYSFASLDDDQIARKSLTDYTDLWTDGDPSKPLLVTDEADWQASYEELSKAGVIAKGHDPAKWFDNSLLDDAGTG